MKPETPVTAESEVQTAIKVPGKQVGNSITVGNGWQDIRANLLYEIGSKVGAVSDLSELVQQIVLMTQRTLKAAASSVLLLDESTQELVFEVVEGEAGDMLKQVRISTQSGIAGWVARNSEPLIVNDVSKDKRHFQKIDKDTGFITKSIMCAPLTVHQQTLGVLEVLNKTDGTDFTEQDMETLLAVASTAAMAIENTRLHQRVLDGYKSTIKALAATIDAKDPYTCGHTQRVMEYALMGGVALSLSKRELEVLEYGGLLHDIGKIGIPDSILSKPSYLSDAEYAIVRNHPVIGAEIIEGIPFLEETRGIVLHHHERYDGKGYPSGMQGEEIPMGARLLAVADVFDALTTDRAYRLASSVEVALNELRRCAGTQFCPVALEAFLDGFSRVNFIDTSPGHVIQTAKPIQRD